MYRLDLPKVLVVSSNKDGYKFYAVNALGAECSPDVKWDEENMSPLFS